MPKGKLQRDNCSRIGLQELLKNELSMMILYHASNIADLTEIKPLSYNHKCSGKVCYFTPNAE
ncbi:MAG: hypothetical protein LBM87_05730 [Ruminococcus sp.]|nr:hypothetical protein [Ruminococcus sp.]